MGVISLCLLFEIMAVGILMFGKFLLQMLVFVEQRRLKEEEYPLLTRVLLGPHEDVAKLFLMDSHNTPEVSSEVAQFLNLTLVECRAILNQYYSQEEKEVARLKEK